MCVCKYLKSDISYLELSLHFSKERLAIGRGSASAVTSMGAIGGQL